MSDLSVCSKCGTKKDGSGYSVDGCIEAGNSNFRDGKYSQAKGYYQRAYSILKLSNGCCMRDVQRRIDEC